MSELKIMPARSAAEADEALGLAFRVFTEHSPIRDYADFKTILWREDPHYRPENLLLARNNSGRLAGLVRIVPRALYRVDQKFSVAGISSVCVDPGLRGKGFSAPLMEYALEQSRARGFDLALLIARRAADHYYTRFGFWGISSYNKATIALPNPGNETPLIITLLPAKPEHTGLHSEAYLACYRNAFGYFERTPQYWDFLLKKAGYLTGLRWFTIAADGIAVGYAIASRHIVHEIAWVGELPAQSLAMAVSTQLQPPPAERSLTVEIPPQHRLFAASQDADITLGFRECSYGGHMVKILDISRARELLAARISDKLGQLGVRKYAADRDGLNISCDSHGCRVDLSLHELSTPSYAQTCRLLGAHALSLQQWDIDQSLPFNVSLPDQL